MSGSGIRRLRKSIRASAAAVIAAAMVLTGLFSPGMADKAYAEAVPLEGNGELELQYKGTTVNPVAAQDINGQTVQMKYTDKVPDVHQFNIKITNSNRVEGKKIKIELADGMSFVDTGAGDDTFTSKMDGKPVTESFDSMTMADYGGDYSIGTFGLGGTKSIEYSVKRDTVSFEWSFSVSPYRPLHYKGNIENAVKVSFTDEAGVHEAAAHANITMYTIWQPSGKNIYASDGVAYGTEFGNITNQGGIYFIPEFTYTVPQGVSVSLRDDFGDAVASAFELTGPEEGNIYKVTMKMPLRSWSYGAFKDPLKYTLGSGVTDAEVPVKIELKNLEADTLTTSTAASKISIKTAESSTAYVYAGYGNNTTALVNRENGRAADHSYESYPKEEYVTLANVFFGNAGKEASKPQTIKYEFNDEARVLAVPAITFDGTKVSEFKISTYSEETGSPVKIDETVTLATPKGNGKAWTASDWATMSYYVTAQELGLGEGEYLTALSYEMGTMPAQSQTGGGVKPILGRPMTELGETVDVGTLEIFTTENPEDTTGQSKISFTGKIQPMMYGATSGSSVSYSDLSITSGSSGRRIIRLGSNGHRYSLTDYAIYVAVPKDVTIDDVVFYNRTTKKAYREEIGVSRTPLPTNNEELFYYRLDFSKIPLSDRSWVWGIGADGKMLDCNIDVGWTYNVRKTAKNGTYPFKDMVFVEWCNYDNSVNIGNSGYIMNVKGNPLGFAGEIGKLTAPPGGKSLIITRLSDVIVEMDAGSPEMTEQDQFIKYDPADPQTVLPVGVGNDDRIDIRTKVTNNCGNPADPGCVKIWQPIPKKGEDWSQTGGSDLRVGTKDKNGNDVKTLPYSLVLQNYVKGVDTDIWKVEYGIKVDPTVKTSDWDTNNGTWKTNPTKAELKDVNCIRFTAINEVPALDENDNPWTAEMISEVIVESDDLDRDKGSIRTLTPLVYRHLTDIAGRTFTTLGEGDSAAMSIAIGKIKGTVFHDRNRDGQQNNGESAIGITGDGPYTVTLLGGLGDSKLPIKTTRVRADGTYRFTGLATGSEYNGYYAIRVTNRDGSTKDFHGVNDEELYDTDLIVSPKADNAEGGKTTGNAFIHANDPAAEDAVMKGYAYSTPVTAIDHPDFDFNVSKGGYYNLGVYYGDSETTNKTFIDFRTDHSKGDRTNAEQGDWIKTETNEESLLSLSGAAVDTVKWPTVKAKAGYTFMGWQRVDPKTNEHIGDLISKAPESSLLGYTDKAYQAVFKANSYTISFDSDGGSPVGKITQDFDTEITPPADPTKEGNKFGGWEPALPEKMPAKDMTVKAIWTTKPYTITFDTKGGSTIAPITRDYGAAITKPADPTKTGHTFEGWDKAIPEKMPAENMTITAKWRVNQYTISFDSKGGSKVNSITEDYGASVKAPADPTREGYTFDGWDQAIPKTMPARNMTINAKWKINQYKISFDSDGGSKVDPISVNYNAAVTAPEAPEKEGHSFKGWEPALPAKMPAKDLSVKAKWELNEYTISFDSDGGSEVEPLKVKFGKEVTAPEKPSKKGYVFDGWEPALPETMPAEDIETKAKWKPDQFTISFDTDGGSKVEPVTQDYDSEVKAPAAPAKTGHSFDGWEPALPEKMPAEDMTVKAKWKVNKYTITFNSEGGSKVDPVTLDYDAEVKAPADPEKDKFDFKGWYPALPARMPAEDLSVTAIWVEKGSDPTQLGVDGTPVGQGASAAAAENAIVNASSDNDMPGSSFAPLMLKSVKQGKTSVNLKWSKASGAVKYVVYGNRCGRNNKMKKLAETKKAKFNVKKIQNKKLKKGKYHKFMVVALDRDNKVVSSSKIIHVATKGGKAGNHNNVSVQAKKKGKYRNISKVSLKQGKTLKFREKLKTVGKKTKVAKHTAVRYESSDVKVAKISKGKIKAIGKGKCKVYVYAQSGVSKTINVTVK